MNTPKERMDNINQCSSAARSPKPPIPMVLQIVNVPVIRTALELREQRSLHWFLGVDALTKLGFIQEGITSNSAGKIKIYTLSFLHMVSQMLENNEFLSKGRDA